jgi:lipoprotein-releasing system permease protein
LLLTTFRRRPEIGIMRSFGISQNFVLSVFLIQGALIGIIGALAGCALGWGFSTLLASVTGAGGRALPVDPALGQYQIALLLAAAASIGAALWPARAASRIDPVEAISQ